MAHAAGTLDAWSRALAFAAAVAKDPRVAGLGNDPRVLPAQLVALHLPTDTAADAPFGPGCAGVPTTGEGSVEGMADDPVATAASNNPLLKTLVSAVTEADLVDTLNSAEALTVFAPTDDAFAAIPKKQLNALLKDKEALTTVLTHHVVGEQISPDSLAGEHETLAGDMITVEGEGEDFTIGDASVVCGNVQTANATVYVVDQVLMPEM